MKIKPYSFNGTTFPSSDYPNVYIERGSAPGAPGVNAKYLKRPGAWPVYTGKDYQETIYTLKIDCGVNFAEKWETLNRLFYTGDQDTHKFVIIDEDDSNRQYQVDATPTGQPLFGNDGGVYMVKLAFDDPIWEDVSLQSSTWAILTTTDSTDITTVGNMDTWPVFELTPTQAPSTDYRFMAFVRVIPQAPNPWPNRPLDIVGSTGGDIWDTSALVSTGQMLDSGNDLRVFMDGLEVDRWLAFPASSDTAGTSTDTHVWINCDLPAAPKEDLILAAAVTDTSTSLSVVDNFNTREYVTRLPARGWLVLDSGLGSSDSEDVYYEAKTITDTALTFTLASRGARDTLALSHAANKYVRFMPHDIRMVWGDADAATPAVDDRYKPCILNSTKSRNSVFYYTDKFADADELAPDRWRYSVQRQDSVWGRSDVFTTTDSLATTDLAFTYSPALPATLIGAKILSYQRSTAWVADHAVIDWRAYFPDEISDFQTNANGYWSLTKSVIGAGTRTQLLFSSNYGPGGRIAFPWFYYDTSMAGVSTSGDWANGTISIGPGVTIPDKMTYAVLRLKGPSGLTETGWCGAAIDDLYVTLAHPPHVKYWNATAGKHIQLDVTIQNTTAGEGVHINVPMLEDECLILDCNPDAPTAKLNGQLLTGAVELDTQREWWMKLLGGAANTLGYTCNLNGAIELSIVLKYRNRMAYL